MSESVIADDLHIKGEVITQGDIELKGTLEGEVTCRTLLIAEDARVEGKATAEKVVVRGAVDGSIHGIRVTLTSSARVKGELVCKALSVDEEAYFDGTSASESTTHSLSVTTSSREAVAIRASSKASTRNPTRTRATSCSRWRQAAVRDQAAGRAHRTN